jgi:tRNA modification GTPase
MNATVEGDRADENRSPTSQGSDRTDTIFALSSGAPPAAIAVIRMSGPSTKAALRRLTGTVPQPRRASLRALRAADGGVIAQAVIL